MLSSPASQGTEGRDQGRLLRASPFTQSIREATGRIAPGPELQTSMFGRASPRRKRALSGCYYDSCGHWSDTNDRTQVNHSTLLRSLSQSWAVRDLVVVVQESADGSLEKRHQLGIPGLPEVKSMAVLSLQ